MNAQGHFNFEAEGTDGGYTQWLTGRRMAVEEQICDHLSAVLRVSLQELPPTSEHPAPRQRGAICA
jgi:hypothetical protein